MKLSIVEINWIGVLAATFAYFLLGGLWFSQIAFGKKWDSAIGFNRPDDWKETIVYYMVPFLGCLVASMAMASLSKLANVNSYQEAVALGLIAGAGFAATVSFVNAVTPMMRKPLLFGLITGTYHVIGVVSASLIIYAIGN